jgi:hypothetical protein
MSNTDKSISLITDIDFEDLKSKGQTLKKAKSEYKKACASKKSIASISKPDIEDLITKQKIEKQARLNLHKTESYIGRKICDLYDLISKTGRLDPVHQKEQDVFLSNLGLTTDDLLFAVIGGVKINRVEYLHFFLNLFHDIDFEHHLNNIAISKNAFRDMFCFVEGGMKHRYSTKPMPEKFAWKVLNHILSFQTMKVYNVKIDISDRIFKKLITEHSTDMYGKNIATEMMRTFSPMGAFQ